MSAPLQNPLYIERVGPAPRFRIMRDGWEIAITFGQPGQEEDAAFIVTACNHHAALLSQVARLREGLRALVEASAASTVNAHQLGIGPEWDQARALLAETEKP